MAVLNPAHAPLRLFYEYSGWIDKPRQQFLI